MRCSRHAAGVRGGTQQKTVYLEVFLWSDGSPLQPGGNYDLVIDIN
jgi:hypothetical protein